MLLVSVVQASVLYIAAGQLVALCGRKKRKGGKDGKTKKQNRHNNKKGAEEPPQPPPQQEPVPVVIPEPVVVLPEDMETGPTAESPAVTGPSREPGEDPYRCRDYTPEVFADLQYLFDVLLKD